ncbi:MAG: 4-hydroxy-tetrahydrodipicolinate synthase [Polyangia bacterium]|jgi:4-hydroxy-tetrahydrodipicolinate synthase
MLKGVFTALVTPLRNDRVDEESLRRLVDEQIRAGIDGLVPVGTTGESPTLSYQEHIRVVQIVVEEAKKRVPVIAGTGSNSTREAIELTNSAKAVGADATLQVTPYYNKPTQDGLYRHFAAIASAGLPMVLYNVPGRTGCDLLPDTIARLSELPQVVGVKEATGNLQRAAQIIARVGSRVAILSGDDATAMPFYAVGGQGCISVISNVVPADMAAMWDAAASGEWAKARELHYKLFPLSEGLFIEANPIPVKTALAMMGKIGDELRPPLYAMSGANRERVRKILADLGLV